MGTYDQLTVAEKLLLAGFDLEERDMRPFSAEDLVVSAWRRFPDVFGLAGYRGDNGALSFPDSNRVFAEIMGSKPIRQRGLLTKVGSKMYQLTAAGREHARSLSRRSNDNRGEKVSLARETKDELKRLFASKATEKVRNNRFEDLTFFDACTFWGISARSSAIELQGKLAALERIVDTVREVIQGQNRTFEHGGQGFGVQDLDILMEVHNTLVDRFQSEIKIISKRTDQRI